MDRRGSYEQAALVASAGTKIVFGVTVITEIRDWRGYGRIVGGEWCCSHDQRKAARSTRILAAAALATLARSDSALAGNSSRTLVSAAHTTISPTSKIIPVASGKSSSTRFTPQEPVRVYNPGR
jgi:hypothetical protein